MNVDKLTKELLHGRRASDRVGAANVLGKLTISSEDVIIALVQAMETEKLETVRKAVSAALAKRVHQAFLEEHPDLAQKAKQEALAQKAKQETTEHLHASQAAPSTKQGGDMECQQCQQEKTDGDTYEFFYGKYGSRSTFTEKIGVVRRTTTMTTYQMTGKMGAWICNTCVSRRRLMYYWLPLILLFLLICGLPALFVEQFQTAVMQLFGACLSVGAIVAFVRLVRATKQEVGDRMAIGMHKARLRKDGYNAFFTRKERSRMYLP